MSNFLGLGSSLLGVEDELVLVEVGKDDPNVEWMNQALSYDVEAKRWVGFHTPAYQSFTHTRKGVFGLGDGGLFRLTAAPPGTYGGVRAKSRVDVHFAAGETRTMTGSFSWRDGVRQNGMSIPGGRGWSRAIVYNDRQCSGNITLDQSNTRWVSGRWNLNNFRDLCKDRVPFLYRHELIPTALDLTRHWTLQRRFVGNWICIRLEADNDGNSVSLYDVAADTKESFR